jgi:hypothetical protein
MCQLNACFPLLAVVLCLGTARAQSTKTLTGRILSDDLAGYPRVDIRARYFKLDVPTTTNTLLFTAVGMEWTAVSLSADCSTLEIILLSRPTYDFMSVRRVNRQRFKQFKHVPHLHQEAYEKGLFTSRSPCAAPIFTKVVPRPVKR